MLNPKPAVRSHEDGDGQPFTHFRPGVPVNPEANMVDFFIHYMEAKPLNRSGFAILSFPVPGAVLLLVLG